MSKKDIFDFDNGLFEPEELRRYFEMVAYLSKLRSDEDVRILVEMPVLMAKVTLRAVIRMVAEAESKKQAMDVRAQAIEERFKLLETLITQHIELFKDSNWQLMKRSFANQVLDEITDIFQTDLRAFLAEYRR